jgi:4-amino-4-deoxy-L-arabinose transferase-like glycosyltransferase
VSRPCAVILLICAALYLLGNGRVSLWDRDEPRYAQASRQMLESGDWVVPKLLDEPRINKPPLIYWCQAASMAAFRKVSPDAGLSIERRMQRDAAAARLPSSIAMVLTLALIAVVVRRVTDDVRAYWTTLIFGTSGLVIMAAKMCLTDAVLLLFVTVSQFCLYAMVRRRATWGVVIAFAVATGLGLLTKGPVVLGVNATTLVVLGIFKWLDARRASEHDHGQTNLPMPPPRWTSIALKALLALAIILAIGLPWVIAMQHRLPGGLSNTFQHDVLKRMTQPLEQHKGPPGYYLIFFFVSFFPWCLLLPTTIKIAWRHRRDPLIRFSLAAVIGPWVMFELIQTKLPHYVLPCFPFLAILVADTVARAVRREHDEWNKRGWTIAVGVFCVILVALGLGPWAATAPRLGFDRLPYAAMVMVSVAAVALAARIFYLFARRREDRAVRALAVTMIVLMTLLFGGYLPNARFLHLSEDVGGYLQSIGATTVGDVYMIDYKEDSLPFYQGGTIRPQRKNTYLEETPPADWATYYVVTREIYDKIPDAGRAHLDVLKTFRGWAYAAKGRVVNVMVLKKK